MKAAKTTEARRMKNSKRWWLLNPKKITERSLPRGLPRRSLPRSRAAQEVMKIQKKAIDSVNFLTMIVLLHSYGKVLLVLGKEHMMISYIHAQVRLVVENVPTRMLCMMAVKLFVKKVIAGQLSMWILPTVLNVIRVVK